MKIATEKNFESHQIITIYNNERIFIKGEYINENYKENAEKNDLGSNGRRV
jgi:hypothetical protein